MARLLSLFLFASFFTASAYPDDAALVGVDVVQSGTIELKRLSNNPFIQWTVNEFRITLTRRHVDEYIALLREEEDRSDAESEGLSRLIHQIDTLSQTQMPIAGDNLGPTESEWMDTDLRGEIAHRIFAMGLLDFALQSGNAYVVRLKDSQVLGEIEFAKYIGEKGDAKFAGVMYLDSDGAVVLDRRVEKPH